MNIGFLSEALPYLPSAGGFRLYGANLIRTLSRRHRIDLVSLMQDEDAAHVDWSRAYCRSVHTVPPRTHSLPARLRNAVTAHLFGRPWHYRAEVETQLRRLAREQQWDVLHVEGEYAAGLVPLDFDVPTVVSLHDSWTLRCREMLKCAGSLRERLYYRFLSVHELRYARLVFQRFDRCVLVSPRDMDDVAQVAPRARLEVIPNGVDTEYFAPIPDAQERDTLVFHGHFGFAPNIDAATRLARRILPRVRGLAPSARLHLVGAQPAAEVCALTHEPGVELSQNLPDLRRAVCSGQVYLAPVQHGTGVKNKILEAMALGLPIVAHPAAADGLECKRDVHLLLAETDEEFAAQAVRILRDPALAERLAQAGRALVIRDYSWDSRAAAYEALYRAARRVEPSPHGSAQEILT